jgi:hypothetical protein
LPFDTSSNKELRIAEEGSIASFKRILIAL